LTVGGFLTVLLPLACLSLATYTAASRIKTLNSSILDPYLRNLPLTPLYPAGATNLMRTKGLSWQSLALRMASIKTGKMLQKSHGVDPNTLRRRLNGKHKSHKVVHTQQQRLLPPAESAVVRQCIYLGNAA